MVLSFKKGKFLFRRKIKKPVEKPEAKTDSIVCLRYVQFDEFDTTNYVIQSPPPTQPQETVTPAPIAKEISRINSRSLESVTTEEYYDEEELTQLQKKPEEVKLDERTKTVRIEDDEPEEIIETTTVADVSKQSEEPKEEKPIKSILKKGPTEEGEKKSTLIFMMENHDEDDDDGVDDKKEEVVDSKPLKKFNPENVYNKTEELKENDADEEKEYSSNAASIFFDDDEPEPTERVRKIDLKEGKEDVASVGSQTSA